MNLSQLLDLIKSETRLKPEWNDPNYLADLLPRLASYYSTLGEFVANAELEADEAEISYKVARESSTVRDIEKGSSAAAAAAMAVEQSEDERREYVKLKYKARLLFLARQSLEKNLDAIRSKLSFLKKDKEEQR